MKTYTKLFGVLAPVAMLSLAAVPMFGAPGQTGQGIMVNFNPTGVYAISGTETWRFNKSTAATYFVNSWDGTVPTGACSGNCGATPATPAAPAPDSTQVNASNPGKSDVTGSNQCAFLAGGSLTGGTYQQSVIVSDNNNKKWTFTFNYNITPATTSVPPFTAWDLVSKTGDGSNAHINLSAQIAGESAVNNSTNSKVGLKYSFDLGTTLAPRVVGLMVSVDGVIVATPSSTLAFPVDFVYVTNAGSNGNTSYLKDGNARTILNTDTFAGNNDGGADGSALALATMDSVGLDLAPGVHTITLTGTVKGTSALADLPINVTGTVRVITPGCGNNN